jgi:hypothetical protein
MKNILFLIVFCSSFLPSLGQKVHSDSIKDQIVAYKSYYDYSGQYKISIDSTLLHFEIFNNAFSNFALNQYVGNLGSAVFPVLTQDNAGGYDLIFNKYIRYNFYKPEDVINYQTKSPYTVLTYYTGGPKTRQEQNLRIIHTQNVNKYLNVGFLGNLIYSDGEFANQKNKGNSFCLFSSYNGPRYSYNFNINFSTLKTVENGGMYSDSVYEHSTDPSYTLPVNLQGASSVNKSLTIFFQHRLYLTGSYKEDSLKATSRWNEVVSIVHRMQYERSTRSFTDDLRSVGTNGIYDRDFYRRIYIDSTTTKDSVYFRRFENNFLLALNAKPLLNIPAELRFGIKNQLDKVSYNTQLDTSINIKNRLSSYYINSALVGSLTNRFSKTITWGASAELYFTGYKAGNIYLSGDISKTIKNNFEMTLKGDFSLEKAPYFLQEFESNHFKWNNAFTAKQSITIVKASLVHKKYKFALDGETGSYINYLYFGSDTVPEMADKPFTMLRVSAKKYFDWRALHTMFRITVQKSTDDKAMPLPLVSGFNTSFVELFVFKRVLQLQLGFDTYYNTSYYAKAYMPAIGIFYSQSDKKIGNYPYCDVFLNMKIKRARFSLRYDNITSFFEIPNMYYAPHYPFNPGILKIGISWSFYD